MQAFILITQMNRSCFLCTQTICMETPSHYWLAVSREFQRRGGGKEGKRAWELEREREREREREQAPINSVIYTISQTHKTSGKRQQVPPIYSKRTLDHLPWPNFTHCVILIDSQIRRGFSSWLPGILSSQRQTLFRLRSDVVTMKETRKTPKVANFVS